MLGKELKPYLVGYVNGHYEEVDDRLVFAYDELHAIETILQTFDDAKFVLIKTVSTLILVKVAI